MRSLAFSPGGKVLASAGLVKIVKILDTSAILEMASIHGPRDKLRARAWSSDRKILAATGHNGLVWIWKAK